MIRDGTWFSRPNRQYTFYTNNVNSICGYYIELRTPANAAPLNFGLRVTRDMARFREFCETSDNITYKSRCYACAALNSDGLARITFRKARFCVSTSLLPGAAQKHGRFTIREFPQEYG